MNQMTGDKVRNVEDREDNSPEQEKKIQKGQDIEPQAEQWNDGYTERKKEEE